MREILFRGRRKDTGEWIEGYFLQLHRSERAFIVPKQFVQRGILRMSGETPPKIIPIEVIPETVGQFTGLTDKNGKKIFEGDIIQYCGSGYRESMGTIIYDKNFGAFVSKEYESYYVRFGDISQYGTVMGVEVIGNIYDNPELLEKL